MDKDRKMRQEDIDTNRERFERPEHEAIDTNQKQAKISKRDDIDTDRERFERTEHEGIDTN